MPIDVVHGWTGPLDFVLKSDGTAYNLTGSSSGVALALYGSDGTVISTTGDVTVIGTTSGQVRYIPGASDLDYNKSPHFARFSVTSSGQKIYFPNAEADTWTVRR